MDQPHLFPVKAKRTGPGRARRGLNATLKAMGPDGLGRLDPIDQAVVALNRILADQLDDVTRPASEESAYTVGVVAGRYQAALELLLSRDLVPASDGDDGFADLLAAVGLSADPRDRPDPGTPD